MLTETLFEASLQKYIRRPNFFSHSACTDKTTHKIFDLVVSMPPARHREVLFGQETNTTWHWISRRYRVVQDGTYADRSSARGSSDEEWGARLTSHAGIVILDLESSAPLSSLRSVVSEGRATLEQWSLFWVAWSTKFLKWDMETMPVTR